MKITPPNLMERVDELCSYSTDYEWIKINPKIKIITTPTFLLMISLDLGLQAEVDRHKYPNNDNFEIPYTCISILPP